VRSWWRSRNSSTIDGGNFGASPNPPYPGSNDSPRVATARSNASGSTDPGGSTAAALSASRAAIWPAELRTLSPSFRHAVVTALSS
jgi:hypothetical protein